MQRIVQTPSSEISQLLIASATQVQRTDSVDDLRRQADRPPCAGTVERLAATSASSATGRRHLDSPT